MTTDRITLRNENIATLQRGVSLLDRQKDEHTGDQLTITDKYGASDKSYFVTPNRRVFLMGRSLEVKKLPEGDAYYAEGFGTLQEQDPEITKSVLAVYDQFKP